MLLKSTLRAVQKGVQHRQTLVLVPDTLLSLDANGARPERLLRGSASRFDDGEMLRPPLLTRLQSCRRCFALFALLAVRVDCLAQLSELIVAATKDAVHTLYGLRKRPTLWRAVTNLRAIVEHQLCCCAAHTIGR